MSELHEVEIHINPEGNVEAHVSGVSGKTCLQITKEMFQLLGDQVERQQLTDEYNRQVDTQQDNKEITLSPRF